MSRYLVSALAFGGLIFLAFPAQAVIIQTNSAQTTPYGVSNSDLLQTSLAGLPTSVGNFTQEGAGGVPVLNDGLFGTLVPTPPGPANNTGAATGGNNGGTQVTYTFDTTANAYGYDITGINTYVGWGDAGRNDQAYTVYYTRYSSPSIFRSIYTASYASGVGSPSATRVVLTDSASGPLLTNVKSIRFVFNTVENGYTGYRELDVIGTPSVSPLVSVPLFSDSFSGPTIDAAKWQVLEYGLESRRNVPGVPDTGGATFQPGTQVANTTTNPGQLTLGGTCSGQYWTGSTLRSVLTFDATETTIITLDRVSLSGSGSARRSSLWLWGDQDHYVHFSQNVGENGWQWNANDVGGSGTSSPTGGGNNIAAFDSLDGDLGLHQMQIIWTPTGAPGDAVVAIYLDGLLGASDTVSNFPSSFQIMLSGMPRAAGDTVLAVFDNVDVSIETTTAVPEPAALSLLALGWLGALARRRRRRA